MVEEGKSGQAVDYICSFAEAGQRQATLRLNVGSRDCAQG